MKQFNTLLGPGNMSDDEGGNDSNTMRHVIVGRHWARIGEVTGPLSG